jgi:hypothetical protein
MILLDRLLVGGLSFVLGKVAEAVDAERDEERLLREELLSLQMRLELGEISEVDLAAGEAEILKRLREIREEREGRPAEGLRVAGVEAAFTGEEHEPPPAKKRRS